MNISPKGSRAKADKRTSLKATEQSELLQFLLTQLPSKSHNNIKSLLARHQVSNIQ